MTLEYFARKVGIQCSQARQKLGTEMVKMHEIKLCLKVMRPASGRSRAARVEPCHWSEGRGVSLTAGNASQSNARGVTAGKMGRNSSFSNVPVGSRPLPIMPSPSLLLLFAFRLLLTLAMFCRRKTRSVEQLFGLSGPSFLLELSCQKSSTPRPCLC